jgi:phosphoenolpyruvate carboxykinase (ATP)
VIRQDDIVLMQKDASCPGTERNFYVKTDSLDEQREPLVHKAALRADALLENVMVRENGEPDFLDTSKTSNGRAVIQRGFMDSTDASIDLDRADIILFITRRDTIIPPVAKLSAEQAGAFFMLGESMGSSASDLDPGKPKRVVGMNPFVVGPAHVEGNRFYDLMRKNPHVECYLLNTGSVGNRGRGKAEKITVQDSAAIIREIARGGVEWKQDPDWGYQVIHHCQGVDASKFHPERHYAKERYLALTEELRKDRREWLAGFPKLDKRIREAV